MATITLKNPRFISYLAATFLGAFNDNAFKLVVSMASLSLFTDIAAQQRYLSITSALAILPFVLCSGYAGYLADRYRKSNVLRISKAAEILAMGAALAVFMTGQNITHLMATLFLLALHSAFFSPSKYGILPEILAPKDLPKANGYLNMLTFVAIITGSISGALLWGEFKHNPVIIGYILTGVAVLGTLLCLLVPQSPKGDATKQFRLNPLHEIIRGLRAASHQRVLMVCLFGSAMFWMLGGLIYLALILLGKTALGLSEGAAGSLFAFLASGIAVGSVIAGHLIGKTFRRGIILWGALLLSTGCIASGFYAINYTSTAILMALVGMGGGLFVVPVVTLLQQHSPEAVRGQILATASFLDMLGVLLASGLFSLFGMLQLSPAMIICAAGTISLLGILASLKLAPPLLPEAIESLVYFIARRIYNVRLVGEGLEDGAFPSPQKPTVYVCNHVTYVDGLILSMISRKRLRFMVLSTFWKKPIARYVLNAIAAVPFGTGDKQETENGLVAAKEALARGESICIFPEGILSRTGHLYPFKRGIERMVEGTEAQIIPLYLDRLWGSIFSFAGQRFIRKLPRRIPYPVTVAVGKPVAGNTPAWKLNRIVAALGSETIPTRYRDCDTLGAHAIRACKRNSLAKRISDTTGQRMNGIELLTAARIVAARLRTPLQESAQVGVLLPASVGGVIANSALAFLGKTSVNLNFSLGQEALDDACARASIHHIISTRKLTKRLGLENDARLIYLEDIAAKTSAMIRSLTYLQARLLPGFMLRSMWLSGVQQTEATATILFSSGSTSAPKGVMLSHRNLLANIESIATLLSHAEANEPMRPLAGVLPFFHSFGLTTGLWMPLLTGRPVSYHSNPLEAKTVVKMMAKEHSAILIATPTFAKLYAAQKSTPLPALQYVILGGEKLTEATEQVLATAWPQASIMQGYGATELGPVVAINVPDIVHGGLTHRGYAQGSVGKLLPGVAARIVDPETHAERGIDEEGLVLIKSPALMHGYLNDIEHTAAAIQNGWYSTGDIGMFDKHGFLFITDRLSRFSKIGGEMVPHGKIEEALQSLIQPDSHVAVVALSDAIKGEKLCVLTTEHILTTHDMHSKLKASGLPNLWLPSREHFYVVDIIPTLPSGKRDLRACKQLVQHKL